MFPMGTSDAKQLSGWSLETCIGPDKDVRIENYPHAA